MQKPIRPKKPQLEKPMEPRSSVHSFYYLIENYDTKELTFYSDYEVPDDPWNIEEEGEDKNSSEKFWEVHSYASHVSLDKIVRFAEEKGLLLSEIGIVSIEIDQYRTAIQLNHVRKVPDEEYATQVEDHRVEKVACKERHQAALVQWQLDKEQYKVNKAAYDVHKAQQKLNSLQNRP